MFCRLSRVKLLVLQLLRYYLKKAVIWPAVRLRFFGQKADNKTLDEAGDKKKN